MSTEQTYAIDIDGQLYTITSDDIYPQQFSAGFEPHMVKLFRALTPAEGTVFDIGANIGLTGILFSQLAAAVYALEPAPTTFHYLEKNLAAAEVENVTCFNLGLGATPTTSELIFAADNRAGGFVSQAQPAPAGHITEMITIDTLDAVTSRLSLDRLDLLKIDVEGFEGHVLRGGRQTLQRFQPVAVLELNHWCLNAFQRTSIPDFFDLLNDIFPVVYAIDGAHYLDLRDPEDRYTVMYQHIIHMRFPNLAAGFHEAQFASFKKGFQRGFVPAPPPPPPPEPFLSRLRARLHI